MNIKQNLIQIRLLCVAVLLAQTATAQQWTTNNLPSGLIGWWQAESNYVDTVGGNDLTPQGAAGFGPGRFGHAFFFDGHTGSAVCENAAPALNQWSQFTLEAWAMLYSLSIPLGHGSAIISRVEGSFQWENGYQFGIVGDGTTGLFCEFTPVYGNWPGYQTVGACTNVPGVWYHVAATYDNNAVILYLNGIPLVTNVIGPVTITNTTGHFRISMDDNGNCSFNGWLDDVRVYSRALSAAEVAYLYAGPPISCQLLSDGDISVSYAGISGTNYVLDRTFNLSPPANWVPQATNPVGVGGLVVFTNTPDRTTNNFWRIRSSP